jgi:hypothetical protein
MGERRIRCMKLHHFLLLGPMLALGCGTENKTLTQNDFVNQYAADVCAGVVPACLVTADTCSAIQVADRGQQAQTAAQNNWTFMPDAAQVCLSKASSLFGTVKQSMVLKPADYQAFVQACDQVYRGARKANEECKVDADCIGGLICDKDKGYCGTKSVVAQGGGCANIGETCPTGSYCGALGGGIRSCVARIGLGGTCNEITPCLETLRCQTGICGTQLGTAEACLVDQDCSSGFCEPFAHQCADDIRFAPRSYACIEMGGTT